MPAQVDSPWIEWKISVIRRKGSATLDILTRTDRSLQQQLRIVEVEAAEGFQGLILRTGSHDGGGFHVTYDPDTVLRPSREYKVPLPRRCQIAGLFGLEGHGIWMTVRAFPGRRPVMNAEVATQRRIVLAHAGS